MRCPCQATTAPRFLMLSKSAPDGNEQTLRAACLADWRWCGEAGMNGLAGGVLWNGFPFWRTGQRLACRTNTMTTGDILFRRGFHEVMLHFRQAGET